MAFFGIAFFVGGTILGVYYFSATSVTMPLLSSYASILRGLSI